MGEQTNIAWTDSTANFWWGCVKVSDGCKNCYAETWANRWGKSIWGPAATTEREYKKTAWKDVPKWNAEAEAAGVRRRVFVQSMSDFFEDHPQVLPWRNKALQLMQECRHLDFQVLTKRPENINRMIEQATGLGDSEMWFYTAPHVWIGTTVENQEQADRRIPHLLNVPAHVRFLSCEPLLGPVNLTGFNGPLWGRLPANQFIHWVICGGESGHGARPMHPEWARSLRDQCQAAGVPFFFKQWGEWADMSHSQIVASGPAVSASGNVHDWMCQNVTFADNTKRTIDAHSWTPHATDLMYRVGKHAAGNKLDGVEYQQFPA